MQYLSINNQANESVSKYKLLSAYGGPGSLIHTQYGSIIISCIEEWGFLKKIIDLEKNNRIPSKSEEEIYENVRIQAQFPENGNITLSNDERLKEKLIDRKKFSSENFKYLVLVPDIEVKDYNNRIKDNKTSFAVNSTFMPKIFSDRSNIHRTFHEWFEKWKNVNPNDSYGKMFFPPKKNFIERNDGTIEKRDWIETLKQDNLVLICNHGHISNFPWSQYLRWRVEEPTAIFSDNPVNLFESQPCCGTLNKPTAKIVISSNLANASGFDGKQLKCLNCGQNTSLKGIMSIQVICPGHKPWESTTGDNNYYSGNNVARRNSPPVEIGGCKSQRSMKLALTTGNNLYYARTMSSIFLPKELFDSDKKTKIRKLKEKQDKFLSQYEEEDDLDLKKAYEKKIEKLQLEIDDLENLDEPEISDSEKEIQFRYQEFEILTKKSDSEININTDFLKVKNVTECLKNEDVDFTDYFDRIMRIDNMKITTAQLDFSRVEPADADAEDMEPKNIFRSNVEDVKAYPVVENYGEGIFFSFDPTKIAEFLEHETNFLSEWSDKLDEINYDNFSRTAVEFGKNQNWPLYLIHTFSHLVMRELEFRCGYPTASLSERIYVSNEKKYEMYGCLIYTSEGAEGSMGGLIAQTKSNNLTNLISSALKRATICNSDPLCWESEGQGLFDLNFASCFSCSLVSETSCELRNIYLDRKLLIDYDHGYFKKITPK